MERTKAMIQCEAMLALRAGRFTPEELCAHYGLTLSEVEDLLQKSMSSRRIRSTSFHAAQSEMQSLSSMLSEKTQRRILLEQTKASYVQAHPLHTPCSSEYAISASSFSYQVAMTIDALK